MLELLKFRCFLMGSQSRLVQCGDILLEKGHQVLGVISAEPTIQRWAKEKGLTQIIPDSDLASILRREPFDLFLSIDNLSKVPNEVFGLARKFAINFHDGPLPRYAGVNATNWAIMNQEPTHGFTWHVMTEVMDAGDILKQVVFPVSGRETALSLNAKCYEKSIESFAELIDELADGRVTPIRQHLENRTYYGRWKRPPANCTIDWSCSAEEIDALFRGLDYGSYPNPLGLPKLYLGNRAIIAKEIEVLETRPRAAPGTITLVDAKRLRVATDSHEVELRGFISSEGASLSPAVFLAESGHRVGDQLPRLEQERADSITKIHSELCRHESFWVKRLRGCDFIEIPYRKRQVSKTRKRRYLEAHCSVPERVLISPEIGKNPGDSILAAAVLYFARIANKPIFDIDFQDAALRQKVSGAEAFFASQVPLHLEVEHQKGFREFYEGVSGQLESVRVQGSYARDLPFRDPSLRSALSQRSSCSAPVALERVTNLLGQIPHTDAELVIVVPDDGKECVWWYDEEALDGEAIQRMQEQFTVLLNAIADVDDRPVGELSILPERERHRILVEWNDTKTEYPQDTCLHQLFEAQVKRTPEAVAVQFAGRYLTYRELNERSNQLAHHLIGLGVGPEKLVGIALRRSVEMVVSLLATLKAGAAYLPLDPRYPEARLADMLSDSTPMILVGTAELLKRLPQTAALLCLGDPKIEAVLNQAPRCNPTDAERTTALLPRHPAYVIYTSGSTGTPKGAVIRHGELTNYVSWASRFYEAGRGVGAPVNTPLAFDATVTSLYLPLIAGQRIILLPEDSQVEALAELLASGAELTLVKLTPAHLEALEDLLGSKASATRARVFVVGGEALKGHVAAFWRRHVPQLRIVNEYGPTETAVGCCVYQLSSGEDPTHDVPIGRPVANTQLYILDQQLQPVPIGVPGELYIGGAQVGSGYLKRPELTAERFIPDRFRAGPGARLYKTGDLCRWVPDGNIEYLGRTDFQAKIRGFRVEPGEIEAVLEALPGVAQAAVTASEDPRGGKRLVAYLVGAGGRSPDTIGIRRRLSERLPDYMLPAAFVVLEEMPLTSNGKVDRRALPPPRSESPYALEASHKPPENEAERKIAEIWEDVLGITEPGRDDNFFDLGGNSLNLIKVRSRLQRIFGKTPSMVDMFTATTIGAMAHYFTDGTEEVVAQPQSQERIEVREDGARLWRQLRQRIRTEEWLR